jgi:pimeloyl-ACP methyl ester carboxylesterase
MKRESLVFPALASCLVSGLAGGARAAEEWEDVLQVSLAAEHSQTRHDGLVQVDTRSAKGLKAVWNVLSSTDPHRVDWFVRQGAYEALAQAEGGETEKEIERVLKGSGQPLAKEAIVYAVIFKIREAVVKDLGENDDRKIQEVKYHLRKKRGLDYFGLVMPTIQRLDPEKRYLGWIHKAFADKHPRVRLAALTGLASYPHRDNIPLLLESLGELEKKKAKSYREWVLTRHALETLTGMYFRENVEDWRRWWDTVKDTFSIEKRIEEKKEEEESPGKTVVVRRDGLEITVHMKIAGQGYPLLVLPQHGKEADYFRPYFHGIEELCKVYYVRMPSLDDFKGLARDATSNMVEYPTKILSGALADLMTESGPERFALCAHGWQPSHLAMLFTQAYPARVTHLILMNPWSAESYFSKASEALRRHGLAVKNMELVKGADSMILVGEKPKYVGADDAEAEGMGRALYNAGFADPTEPEAGSLRFFHDLPGGATTLLKGNWEAKGILGGLSTPALIFHGERSAWTPASEPAQVSKALKGARLVPMKGSAEYPFIEETYVFTKRFEEFLLPAVKEWEKDKAKEKEKGKENEKGKGKTSTQGKGGKG